MLVRYWMTAPVETATEKTTLLEAFTTMKQGHCHRLPVLRGAELCGIVSRSDLYRY
ncbi:MAG: CBS domain-containing protein, partial [Planctomycetota bacterium]